MATVERRHPLSHPLGILIFAFLGIGLTIGQFLVTSRHFGALLPTTGDEGFAWLALDAFVLHAVLWVLHFSLWHLLEHWWRMDPPIHKLVTLCASSGVGVALIGAIVSWALVSSLIPNDAFEVYLWATIPLRAGTSLATALVAVLSYSLFLARREKQDRQESERRLRESLRESELQVVKARLQPHFLFNSLNSASALALIDGVKASSMIDSLAEFLRRSLTASQQSTVPLREEIEHVRHYLTIESIRFGDRLQTVWNIDAACETIKIPALLLQPLYENAIKHGLGKRVEGVCIQTIASIKDDSMVVEVRNQTHAPSVAKGTGFGLRSIRERLELMYADPRACLRTEHVDDWFVVRVCVPIGVPMDVLKGQVFSGANRNPA